MKVCGYDNLGRSQWDVDDGLDRGLWSTWPMLGQAPGAGLEIGEYESGFR